MMDQDHATRAAQHRTVSNRVYWLLQQAKEHSAVGVCDHMHAGLA